MNSRQIIELINGHLRDFEEGNIENLLKDWADTPRVSIKINSHTYTGHNAISDFYNTITNTYNTHILRVTDLKMEQLANMTCIRMYYTFEGTSEMKKVHKTGRGEIVVELDEESKRLELCSVTLK